MMVIFKYSSGAHMEGVAHVAIRGPNGEYKAEFPNN